jgi:outer membrane protein W
MGLMRARPASNPRPRLPIAGALALALLLGLFHSAPARAQEAGGGSQWVVNFSTGVAKPEGGLFGAQWNRGTTLLLGVGGQMSTHFELGAEFGYVQFKPSGDSVLVPGIGPGDNVWQMWRLRLKGRRFFASDEAKIAPFVSAGLGLYPIGVQSTDSLGTYKVTLSGKGVSFGAGVDYRASDTVHFGLDGQYHYVKTDAAVVRYKAAPLLEILFAIRWFPGAAPPP